MQRLTEADLPDGDVTVAVRWSSLNFKDGLAVTGRGKVVQRTPMVCGIDLAGTVEESSSPDWQPGDEVVATGWGLSVTHPRRIHATQRLPADWLLARPDGLTLSQTMAIGTAGLTAMLCVLDLEHAGVEPGDAEVLVTGAGGGVGSVAVTLLDALGQRVAASTGRPETHDALRRPRRHDDASTGRAGRCPAPGRSRRSGGPGPSTRSATTLARAPPDPLRRRRRRLRAGRRGRPADHRAAIHPAQHPPPRRRLRRLPQPIDGGRHGGDSPLTCRPMRWTR